MANGKSIKSYALYLETKKVMLPKNIWQLSKKDR